jgi:hypothetical protein
MTYTPARDPPSHPCFLFFERRRNTLEGGRTDAIRKVGPQFSLISEFWTKLSSPREYGGFDDGVGTFAEAMRARKLDLMFKENPAKVLGLKAIP